MSIEPLMKAPSPALGRHRIDSAEPGPPLIDHPVGRLLRFALIAGFFVILGGGSLDLGPIEAKLGLAAEESFGPFGQVMGSWEPSIWPGTLAPSLFWAWAEGGFPTSGAVRWPSVIAGIAIGFVLSRRVGREAGTRAALLVSLTWLGSLAMIDRSAGAGIDLITAVGVILAIDRLLTQGADLVAGSWTALAVLCGGWPPLALIVLSTIVIGRNAAMPNWRLMVPSVVVLAVWSGWAIRSGAGDAWGAAIALPLTQQPAWFLSLSVLALGLPWTPFLALQAAGSVRGATSPEGRKLSVGWLQVAGACLVAGTIIPGVAGAAKVPAIAGLAVVAGITLDSVVFGQVSAKAQRRFLGIALALALLWFVVAAAGGGYLAAAVSYYRGLSIALFVASIPVVGVAWYALENRRTRAGLFTVIALAIFLKLGHWGYYVPEWNYRFSQGPWGRAIGQWVPPKWPVYTTLNWNPDLAFAIGRPIRRIVSDRHLRFEPGEAKFVLLLEGEFKEWSSHAPPITQVSQFQNERGEVRILARTAGPRPWTRKALANGGSDE